ncbi:MAG: hypothetical protein ACKOCM_08115 [Cyanobacteriota bacterium]
MNQTGSDPDGKRQLHPLPRGLVELYGLLAVLFVLVPEWMAGSAMGTLPEGGSGSELPVRSSAWSRIPELHLATLSLREMRLLAREEHLWGYARLSRQALNDLLQYRLRGRERRQSGRRRNARAGGPL